MKDYITLKWKTIKDIRTTSDEGKLLLEEYIKLGSCSSRVMQEDTPRQKEIICQLIDLMPGKVLLEWDNKEVSHEEAKEYVLAVDKSWDNEDVS